MHLILTHEQADFDAVAAQLAVWRLHADAVPVLPHRLNRNVRAYLTLYAEDLPFVEPDDLPRGSVERITLVDSQAPPSVKGTSAETRVHLIDHHPPAHALPPSWTAMLADTGAVTTLMVEELEDQARRLTLAQATLLLLGIYEDTGSLSYLSTTPRDVRAAAWLLEQGASLQVASDFLNHPLTPDQYALYERLLDSMELHDINGQQIAIACAQAGEMVAEISTLAHKLRDVYDPPALFLLVGVNAHVQLVARSASDAVDVAEVAARFGGGGHDRAAAALVKDQPVEIVREQLLEYLRTHVQPALTVNRLMSLRPVVIEPGMRIQEAASLMLRHGFEGLPVVDPVKGQVLGLLTRRAVDRATAHRMGAHPVRDIMEAGQVFVRAADSVGTLQRVMVESGWGQVPVVDEAGKVAGIVTRTDLLKMLAPPGPRTGRRDLSGELAQALPPVRLALLRRMGAQAAQVNATLYLVGGLVRDLLLGAPVQDFDLVVEGDAIALAKSLSEAYGGRVTSHSRFGTAKWHLAESRAQVADRLASLTGAEGPYPSSELPPTVDLVSARKEFYPHPTALPQVERGSIKLDLHRRDFTINTLALRLDEGHFGELLDFWGGERDLQERKVRVLHSLSFVDDPTRLLRAVRLEQRLSFQIEERTLHLVRQAVSLFGRVSGERIRHELEAMIEEGKPQAMLARLHDLGALESIHPALHWDERVERMVQRAAGFSPDPDWKVAPISRNALFFGAWWSTLETGLLEGVLERLKFKGSEGELIRAVNRLSRVTPELTAGLRPSEVVRTLEDFPVAALALQTALAPPEPAARIREFLSRLRFVSPRTGGGELRRRGLTPGPAYGLILRTLRDAWLDGEITTPDEEAARLDRLLAEVDG